MKRVLMIAGGGLALMALLVVVAVRLVDLNRYKPQLEASASQALGAQVRIGGRVGLGLFPGLHVVVMDGQILGPRGGILASARRTNIGIALLPLLAGRVHFRSVDVRQPRVTFEKAANDSVGPGSPWALVFLLRSLNGGTLSVSDGSIAYIDRRTGNTIDATGIDLLVTKILIQYVRTPDPFFVGVAFNAQIACDSIRTKAFVVRSAKASIFASGGVVDVRPISMRVFGGILDAEIHARRAGMRAAGTGVQAALMLTAWDCQVRCSLPGFRIEQFLASQSTKKTVNGAMDFSTTLTMRGNTKSEFVKTAAGEMSLRGKDLTLEGSDLDQQLSRFESTQNFNLVDAGAVFFAGPLGLAVTKGYNFGSLFLGQGSKSKITTVVSEWKVEHGVAQAKDVAMATLKNRMALQGGLDFANERFADVTVAVVDEKGCAKAKQTIRGSFAKPEVEKPHIVSALAGSVVNELKRVRNVLPNGPCEAFYTGSVAAPR